MTNCVREGCTRPAVHADMCDPCSEELYQKLTALTCAVCERPYPHNVARVTRQTLDPGAPLDHVTPKLCWICARLHHAAHQAESAPMFI